MASTRRRHGVLAVQGRLPEAFARLERAVALDNTHAAAWEQLAGLYRAAGRPEDAGRALRPESLQEE